MGRYQQGYIYEASGAFFVRYYSTEIVDGKAERVQRSHRLCSKRDLTLSALRPLGRGESNEYSHSSTYSPAHITRTVPRNSHRR